MTDGDSIRKILISAENVATTTILKDNPTAFFSAAPRQAAEARSAPPVRSMCLDRWRETRLFSRRSLTARRLRSARPKTEAAAFISPAGTLRRRGYYSSSPLTQRVISDMLNDNYLYTFCCHSLRLRASARKPNPATDCRSSAWHRNV